MTNVNAFSRCASASVFSSHRYCADPGCQGGAVSSRYQLVSVSERSGSPLLPSMTTSLAGTSSFGGRAKSRIPWGSDALTKGFFSWAKVVPAARELEELEFPEEYLTSPTLRVGVAVTHHQPEGEPWGRYVVMLVVSDPDARGA